MKKTHPQYQQVTKYFFISLMVTLFTTNSFANESLFEPHFVKLKERVVNVHNPTNPPALKCLGLIQADGSVLTHESCIKGISKLQVSKVEDAKTKLDVTSFDGMIEKSNRMCQLSINWEQHSPLKFETISLAKPIQDKNLYFVFFLDKKLQYKRATIKEINAEEITTEAEDFDPDGIDWEMPTSGFLFSEDGQLTGYALTISNLQHSFSRTVPASIENEKIVPTPKNESTRPADFNFLAEIGHFSYYEIKDNNENSHLQFLLAAGFHYNHQYKLLAGINLFDQSLKVFSQAPIYTGVVNIYGILAAKQILRKNDNEHISKIWTPEYGIAVGKNFYRIGFTIMPQVNGYSVGI